MATATLMSMFGVVEELVVLQGRVEVRELAQGQRRRLDDQVVEGDLAASSGAWALTCSRSAAALTMSTSDDDIEVRRGLLRLGHPPAGRAADPAHLARRCRPGGQMDQDGREQRAGAAGAGAGAGAGAAAWCRGGGLCAQARRAGEQAAMSSLTMRPPGPVPAMLERSMPCSAARRLTSGEARRRSPEAVAPAGSLGASADVGPRPRAAIGDAAAAGAGSRATSACAAGGSSRRGARRWLAPAGRGVRLGRGGGGLGALLADGGDGVPIGTVAPSST